MMKITKIEAQRLNPERVNVHVDGAFRLGRVAELVLAEGEPAVPSCFSPLRRRWRNASLTQRTRSTADLPNPPFRL